MKFSPKVSKFHKSCPGDICEKSHIFQVKLTSTAFVKSTLSSLLSEVRTNHTYWLVFTHLPFTALCTSFTKDKFPGWRFSWPLVGDWGGPGNAAACQIWPPVVPLLLNWSWSLLTFDCWTCFYNLMAFLDASLEPTPVALLNRIYYFEYFTTLNQRWNKREK